MPWGLHFAGPVRLPHVLSTLDCIELGDREAVTAHLACLHNVSCWFMFCLLVSCLLDLVQEHGTAQDKTFCALSRKSCSCGPWEQSQPNAGLSLNKPWNVTSDKVGVRSRELMANAVDSVGNSYKKCTDFFLDLLWQALSSCLLAKESLAEIPQSHKSVTKEAAWGWALATACGVSALVISPLAFGVRELRETLQELYWARFWSSVTDLGMYGTQLRAVMMVQCKGDQYQTIGGL